MEFCPKCNGMLMPKNGVLTCKCGYTKEITQESQKNYKGQEKIKTEDTVIFKGEDVNVLPKTKVACPECGNNEAYWQLRQTRSADEAETRFLECTKCGHRWREYD